MLQGLGKPTLGQDNLRCNELQPCAEKIANKSQLTLQDGANV